MSATRRVLLLNWATRNGSWIVEDDYDNEFCFGVRSIASLQGLDKDERVIYVGTFSKVLFPSLRIGYLIIPDDLIPPFSRVRETSDISTVPLSICYQEEPRKQGLILGYAGVSRKQIQDGMAKLTAILKA